VPLSYRILKGRPLYNGSGEDSDGVAKFQTHVFDYSFLRERVSNGTADTKMATLADAMPSFTSGDRQPCTSRSSFRETTSSGVERTKHTLESQSNADGASYVIHVEIDRRLAAEEELLRDVRLVIRAPALTTTGFDPLHSARQIIVHCVKEFLGLPESEVPEFFLTRFGWANVV
jgi:hypothetical protein